MYLLQNIDVKGFWEDKSINFDFYKDQNFVIGVNGSGKTTLINLIGSVLYADFAVLDKIPFDSVTLTLVNAQNSNLVPIKIYVQKLLQKNSPYPDIILKVSKGKRTLFNLDLDQIEESNHFRYPTHIGRKMRRDWTAFANRYRINLKEIGINPKWLTVNRFRLSNLRSDDSSSVSLVDQKLKEIEERLIRYFSSLDNLYHELTEEFQKEIVKSLLFSQTSDEIANTIESINIEEEKKSLDEIFTLLKVKKSDFSTQLTAYFNSFQTSWEKFMDAGISIEEAEFILGVRRIHFMVDEYRKLRKKQVEIFKYRNQFVKELNALYMRKEIFINKKNEIKIRTTSGKEFNIHSLSSGEKQLLIILGEALIHENKPYIFIADEPELSLHLDWQEKLVLGLRNLNQNVQIIFATHSPDIVGQYENSIIEIEDLIKNEKKGK